MGIKAPVIWAGAFFLIIGFRIVPASDLALQLYAEGDWRGARVEAFRAGVRNPEDPWASAVAAWATLRIDPGDTAAREVAFDCAHHHPDPLVRAHASYELGRILWSAGESIEAFPLLRAAFLLADDQALFLKSAYSLDSVLRRHPELRLPGDSVIPQLRTVRPLITRAVRQAAWPPPPIDRDSWSGRAARYFVGVYQRQISPAIGHRCSMHPSCSRFCVEACATYGLIGIPMTADRLIRESDHVVHRIAPVMIGGEERFYDPVSHHSFWFRRYRR